MKAGREHRVPLSESALDILSADGGRERTTSCFPARGAASRSRRRRWRCYCRRLKAKDVATIHGFRSSFRDWAGDATSFPREIVEQALAHRVGDATEIAYRRSDALERRREVMDAWARYCSAVEGSDKVVTLAAHR